MFRPFLYCYSNFLLKEEIYIYLSSRDGLYKELKSEQCSCGKNINLRYKDLIEKFSSVEGTDINYYFCINYNNTNFHLYNYPLFFIWKLN